MSRIGIAAGVVSSTGQTILTPDDNGVDGQVLSLLGDHPTIPSVKRLGWVNASAGDALVANSLDQFAFVTQAAGKTFAITDDASIAGTHTGASSGTNTGDNAVNSLYSGLVSNATHTGDATGSGALTLATVNGNVGSFGGSSKTALITVNAKGLVTAISEGPSTPGITNITGLGTGVGTFLVTPSSANLAAALTDETGTAGSVVFSVSPTVTGTLTAAAITATGTITTGALSGSLGTLALKGTTSGTGTLTVDAFGNPILNTTAGSAAIALAYSNVTINGQVAIGTSSLQSNFRIHTNADAVFSSCTGYSGTADVTLGRNAAGVWQMGTTANNALGSLLLTNLTASGNVIVGSGTAITKVLSATAILNFGSIAAGGFEDLTITVTGATVGNTAIANPPTGSVTNNITYTAWVSASNTVTVRASNNNLTTAMDPASGTFRATVIQF